MIHRLKTTAAGVSIAAALLAGLAPAIADDGPTEPAYTYNAEVVDVIDGDTVDLNVSLGFYVWIRYQRIKLAGINTVGRIHPHAAGPISASMATQRTGRRIRSVRLYSWTHEFVVGSSIGLARVNNLPRAIREMHQRDMPTAQPTNQVIASHDAIDRNGSAVTVVALSARGASLRLDLPPNDPSLIALDNAMASVVGDAISSGRW